MSSYLQVAALLKGFDITLPEPVQALIRVQDAPSRVVEQTLSFDCAAGKSRGLELFFLKQTIAMSLPLVLPVCAAVCWLLISICRKKSLT